jgi:hypothetical protein
MNDVQEMQPPQASGPVVIDAEEYARRLRVMLGPGTSGGLPRRQRDRWILLHAIAAKFGENDRLSEKEATARIQDFLMGREDSLGLDAVTLRRALVDYGFIDRDDHGRDYRRSKRHERWVRVEVEQG